MRVLKSSHHNLTSPTFVASDGETPKDTAALATCTVAREDGTALAAPTVTNEADPGVYTAALTTTHTGQLDRLTVTWQGTVDGLQQTYTQDVEVVGAHYVTIPEIRAERGLDDTAKYPVGLLREVRDEFEDLVEEICGVAFVRRYHRDRLDGNTTNRLLLTKFWPRTIISVKIDGTAKTVADFDLYDHGTIVWRNGWFTRPTSTGGQRNCAIAYEHGYDAPPPKLRREALKWIAMVLHERTSGVPRNAISETFGETAIRYSTPDASAGRPTGVLSLDPLLVELSKKTPGIA